MDSQKTIAGFLDQLSVDGFRIGTEEHLRVQQVLSSFEVDLAQRVPPSNWGDYIAPIVCQSPSEYARFRQLWKAFVQPTLAPIQETSAQISKESEETTVVDTRPERVWASAIWAAAVLGICALAMFGIYQFREVPDQSLETVTGQEVDPVENGEETGSGAFGSGENNSPTAPPEDDRFAQMAVGPGSIENPSLSSPFKVSRLLWALTPIFFACLWLIWRLRRQFALERQFDSEQSASRRIALDDVAERPFSTQQFLRKVRDLNIHSQEQSTLLDLKQTISAALKKSGFPELAFVNVPRTPEYLLFVERVSRRDHLAAYGRFIASALQSEKVHFNIFEFHGDIRFCTSLAPGGLARMGTLSIDDIAASHTNARVMVLCSRESYFDSLESRLADWFKYLEHWEAPTLLTTTPVDHWSRSEQRIKRQGLDLVPATSDGLRQLIDSYSARQHQDWRYEAPEHIWSPRYPVNSIEAADSLGGVIAADDERAQDVLIDLEDYLGTRGYRWLQATAVFPLMVPEITMQLGAILRLGSEDPVFEGQPLLDEEALLRLVRLPWFRSGSMPEPLRRMLLKDMSRGFEEQVRETLNSVLLSAWDSTGEDWGMDIIVRKGPRWRDVLLGVIGRSPKTSPLREYLFLNFMKGGLTAKMAVHAPGHITQLLRKGWDFPAIAASVTASLCAVIAWAFDPSLYVARAWTNFVDSTAMTELEFTLMLGEHEEWLESDSSAGSRAAFNGRNLSALNSTVVSVRDISQSSAISSDFTGASIFATRFNQATLSSADFSQSVLSGLDFSGSDLSASRFAEATIEFADFNRANMSSADFGNTRISSSSFRGANAGPIEAGSIGATFVGSNMSFIDFRGAQLRNSVFDFAVLDEVNFDAALLASASFRGSDLRNAVGLTQDQLAEACGDISTKLPVGLTIPDCDGGALSLNDVDFDRLGRVSLRIQTQYSPESLSGQAVQSFVDTVQERSNGTIEFEVFYTSSVVKSAETFDAAAVGILDCDMTGPGYLVGKDPAFQAVSDLHGVYHSPQQQVGWLRSEASAAGLIQELYSEYGMHFIGYWIPGAESLSATSSVGSIKDIQGLKFRSPPGLAARVWTAVGAEPIVMDFNEIFTALETGTIDGADASTLIINLGLGLPDVTRFATYPGFSSMQPDHLACRSDAWDALNPIHQNIITVSLSEMASDLARTFQQQNDEAAEQLSLQGITLQAWSEDDLAIFRGAALNALDELVAPSDLGVRLMESHRRYIQQIGLRFD